MCGKPGCEHREQPLSAKEQGDTTRSRNWRGPFRKTPGRLFGMAFIRLYQLTFSGFIGNSCRHIPTCSEYGYEAIARHGFWAGGWLTLFRVARCGPGGTSGLDPVPGELRSFRFWQIWKLWRLKQKTGEASK